MQLPLKELSSLLRALQEANVQQFEYEDEAYKLRLAFAGAELEESLGDADSSAES